MPSIALLLDSALTEEPDYAPDVAGILVAARRTRRNHRLAVIGSGAALTVGVGGLAVALVTGGSPAGHEAAGGALSSSGVSSVASRVPTSRVLSAATSTGPGSGGTDVHGITRHNLAALIEQKAGVRLSGVSVQDLPPTGDIDLSAGLASAQGQYLNVQVAPAGTSSTTAPACAEISGDAPDGDGYTGPCNVTTRPGGGYLVVRGGRTADGRYAITEAELVSADGTSISAEASNQLAVSRKGIAPVVTHDPPLTSARLRVLVLALNAQR